MKRLVFVLPFFAVLAVAVSGCQSHASGGSSGGSESEPTPEPTPPPTGGTYQPNTLNKALDRFGACMERSIWDEVGMPDLAYQNSNSAAGAGRCYSCHYTGTGGAYLSNDEDAFFSMNTQKPFIYKLVLGTVNDDGSFKDLVPAWRFRDRGDEGMHPKYSLTDERELALREFVERTLLRYHDYTDSCGMP